MLEHFLFVAKGCLQRDEPCSNVVCPDEWKEYDFTTTKFGKANRKLWLDISTDQICKLQGNAVGQENQNRQEEVDWQGKVAAMSSIKSYDDLEQYVNNNPLPAFNDEPNDSIVQQESSNLDMVALHHLPDDAPKRTAPVSVEGDGNHFPRTISYLLYKSERRYMEMHARIVYEVIKNLQSYLDDNYISVEALNFYNRATLPQQYAQYSDNYVPNTDILLDVVALYKQEVMDICIDGAYMGTWQTFQTANVLNCPIRSVFPNIGNENVIKDLNRTVYCIDRTKNTQLCVNIMWTSIQIKRTRPCHFVPLLRVIRHNTHYT